MPRADRRAEFAEYVAARRPHLRRVASGSPAAGRTPRTLRKPHWPSCTSRGPGCEGQAWRTPTHAGSSSAWPSTTAAARHAGRPRAWSRTTRRPPRRATQTYEDHRPGLCAALLDGRSFWRAWVGLSGARSPPRTLGISWPMVHGEGSTCSREEDLAAPARPARHPRKGIEQHDCCMGVAPAEFQEFLSTRPLVPSVVALVLGPTSPWLGPGHQTHRRRSRWASRSGTSPNAWHRGTARRGVVGPGPRRERSFAARVDRARTAPGRSASG